MFQIKRGQRPSLFEMIRIHRVRDTGRGVDRFAVGIAERVIDSPSLVRQAGLEGIEIRIPNAGLISVIAECGSERTASTVDNLAIGPDKLCVLAERSARRSSGCDIGWLAQ